jgi:cytochrome oxidase assembly protein ShyY1
VIRFRSTLLAYALTWFALAAMAAAGVLMLARHERRSRA